jgi:hypothetical protein
MNRKAERVFTNALQKADKEKLSLWREFIEKKTIEKDLSISELAAALLVAQMGEEIEKSSLDEKRKNYRHEENRNAYRHEENRNSYRRGENRNGHRHEENRDDRKNRRRPDYHGEVHKSEPLGKKPSRSRIKRCS